MKLYIFIFAVNLGCQAFSDVEISEKWKNFQLQFVKNYKSPVESTKRFDIFKNKLVSIEEHNKRFENGEVSWKKGINKFSDLTPEEFQTTIKCVLKERTLNRTFVQKTSRNEDYPDSMDWRSEKDVISDVIDQGECEACWAISTTGAIESQYKIQQSAKIRLSAQNFIDCVNKKNGYESDGCNGGYIEEALVYAELQGITTEEAYPFKGESGKCQQKTEIYKIFAQLPVPPYEKNLLGVIGTIGPAPAYMEVTNDLQDYASGVFSVENCGGNLNHAVLNVGYGKENGEDFWLIKNSWGKNWGDEGFFKISRKNGSCGILENSLFAAI